ncbi:hypothetical protein Tco_1007521 [Tanacetum coccineum]
MAVRVPPAMLSGLSASMTEVAAMFESTFRKRFRSSYKSSLSSSPPDLPSRKRYRGTSELVEDSEEDDDEEDEEIEESLDSDSVSEDAEDEGPTAEDEDPAILYRADGGDFVENCGELWFIVINNPFWKAKIYKIFYTPPQVGAFFQETEEWPSIIKYPVKDLRVNGHLAQSESQYEDT